MANKSNACNVFFSIVLGLLSGTALIMRLDMYSLAELIETSGVETPHAWFRFLWDMKLSTAGYSISAAILVALLTAFYFYCCNNLEADKRERRICLSLSLIYAFFFVFGESFKRYSSWDGVFGSLRNLSKAGIKYVGAVCLAYALLVCIYQTIEKQKLFSTGAVNRKDVKIGDKQLLLVIFALIIVCWLPYAVAYYPGLTNYDFFDMLDTYYGRDTNSLRVVVPINDNVTLNNNNPVLQVMFAVFVMKIGEVLGSPYYGIAVFCYSQMIIFAMILSGSIVFMRNRGINRKIVVATVLFYCALPWHPNFALTTLKDTNYSFFSLVFLMLLIDMTTNSTEFFSSKRKLTLMGVISLLLMLLRNNGVYVLLLSFIILLVINRNEYKKILLAGFVPVFIYMVLITRLLYPSLGISPGGKAEMYSLPFQQIARVIKEEGDSIEKNDVEIISSVLNDYDELADRYDPELADPVKSRYNKYATSEDMQAFLGVWLKYLAKYPGIYIQAAICDCFGYFYPEAEHWLVYTQIEPPGEAYGLASPEDRAIIRKELNQMAYILKSMPGVGMLMSVGAYSWVMILMIGFLIYSRRKDLIALWIPNLVLLLTVLAGPVNTMPRYVYPIILSTPLLIAFSLMDNRKDLVVSEKELEI